MPSSLSTLEVRYLLNPLISALPIALQVAQPPAALLTVLSPILRQRVQLLSSPGQHDGANTSYLAHLSYANDAEHKLPKLISEHAQNYEPHPVSGEIELDWERDVTIRYKRCDEETLNAFVDILELGIMVKLVWCMDGDVEAWRIGALEPMSTSESDVFRDIGEAETAYKTLHTNVATVTNGDGASSPSSNAKKPEALTLVTDNDDDDDDDDDYWAQYDQTPGRTPAPKRSPGPGASISNQRRKTEAEMEEDYYGQYDTVQPALDNDDPDESPNPTQTQHELATSQLRASDDTSKHTRILGTQSLASIDAPSVISAVHDGDHTSNHPTSALPDQRNDSEMAAPRSSRGSNSEGQTTVAHLEESAATTSAASEQMSVGVRRHIANTVKSLFFLSQDTGIDRRDFLAIVQRELQCLEMYEDGE